MADNENDKWARARELVAEEQDLSGRYAIYKRVQALDARFAHCDRAKVLQMFEAGTNDKGEPLSQFEFEALCERRCAVFGFLPPLKYDPSTTHSQRDPLPNDDAMLDMHDVVRISGLSESTIKRRLADPKSDFPRPRKLSPRRLGWPAHEVIASKNSGGR